MGQYSEVVAADIDRISNRGNCIATFNNTEYNIGRLSVSDTSNRLLLGINGDSATKLYVEKEWTDVCIDRISDEQAYVEIDDEWDLQIKSEIEFYDLDKIFVDFGNVIEKGDNINIQINSIGVDEKRVFASPLITEGGLYETTRTVSQIDEKGRGLIGTQYDRAQIAIKEFGGLGSEKVVFRIKDVTGPQATGVRYFYPGEELFITPDGELSSDTYYTELSDERRMVIENVVSNGGRMKVEVIDASFEEVLVQQSTSNLSSTSSNISGQPAHTDTLETTDSTAEDVDRTENSGNTNSQQESKNPDSHSSTEDTVRANDGNKSSDQESKIGELQSDSDSDGSSRTDFTEPNTQDIYQIKKGEQSSRKDNSNLNELREKAEKDSVEDVPEEATSATQETSQYSRSKAVREYVIARANGQCEGCEEPAPFTSKTDDPYLHAHHIHELSDGGSDTPDTVIALCPNCHYQVHHGKDGEAYNDHLKRKLEKIENEQS